MNILEPEDKPKGLNNSVVSSKHQVNISITNRFSMITPFATKLWKTFNQQNTLAKPILPADNTHMRV